jgi:hypothetical protein
MDETDGSLPYHVYQSNDYFPHDAMLPSLFFILTFLHHDFSSAPPQQKQQRQ